MTMPCNANTCSSEGISVLQRLDRLEAQSAIRRLMAALHEAGDANEGDAVAELFTSDGVWEGTGRLAALLGAHRGRAAIARRYCAGVHPMSFTAHFLTNEAIVVDGDSAQAAWRYLQAGHHPRPRDVVRRPLPRTLPPAGRGLVDRAPASGAVVRRVERDGLGGRAVRRPRRGVDGAEE